MRGRARLDRLHALVPRPVLHHGFKLAGSAAARWAISQRLSLCSARSVSVGTYTLSAACEKASIQSGLSAAKWSVTSFSHRKSSKRFSTCATSPMSSAAAKKRPTTYITTSNGSADFFQHMRLEVRVERAPRSLNEPPRHLLSEKRRTSPVTFWWRDTARARGRFHGF